jgi:hypothetical protein
MNAEEWENEFLARARVIPRCAAEDDQVLQDMSEGNAPPDPLRTGNGCDHLHFLPRPRSHLRTGERLKEPLGNSEHVSRSQLLLQYLLAVDVTDGNSETFEHFPDISEVRGGAGDSECLV